jgi:hypothetical protein
MFEVCCDGLNMSFFIDVKVLLFYFSKVVTRLRPPPALLTLQAATGDVRPTLLPQRRVKPARVRDLEVET